MSQKAAEKRHAASSEQTGTAEVGQAEPKITMEQPAPSERETRPGFARDERGNIKIFTF